MNKDIDILTSAKECLSNFLSSLSEQSEQSTNDNLDVRKNYWRILSATKHLQIFENSSEDMTTSITQGATLESDGSLNSVINSITSVPKSSNSSGAIEPVPVPAILFDTEACKSINSLWFFPIGWTEGSHVNSLRYRCQHCTDEFSRTSVKNHYSSKHFGLGLDIKVSVFPKGHDKNQFPKNEYNGITEILESMETNLPFGQSTPAAKVIAAFDLSEIKMDDASLEKIRIDSDMLEKYTSMMGCVRQDTDLQQWLEVNKEYWKSLRKRKRDDIQELIQQKLKDNLIKQQILRQKVINDQIIKQQKQQYLYDQQKENVNNDLGISNGLQEQTQQQIPPPHPEQTEQEQQQQQQQQKHQTIQLQSREDQIRKQPRQETILQSTRDDQIPKQQHQQQFMQHKWKDDIQEVIRQRQLLQQQMQQPQQLQSSQSSQLSDNFISNQPQSQLKNSSHIEPDLASERMAMSGFATLAKALPLVHPADVTMTLWGVDRFDMWPTLQVATNPSYSYEDSPLPGWRKNICVRMGGKTQGTLDVTYSPPERSKRLRSKIELQAYLTRYNLSMTLSNRFDFRTVFCVCHANEDSGSYLECSYGRAGCNKWLHSQCVGLGRMNEKQLSEMETVICPLCTVYLESIGAHEFMKGKICLREITTNLPQTSVVVNGFEVFESSRPHTQWGIQASKSSISSSSCSYTSIKQQPNYVYSSENNNCTNGTSTFSHHGNPNINSIVDSNTRDDFKKQDKSPQHQKEETLIASTPLSTPLCVPEGSSELSLLPSADATIIPSSGGDLSAASKTVILDTPIDPTVNSGINAISQISLKAFSVDSPIISKADIKGPIGSKIPVTTKTNEKAPSKSLSSDPMLASMLMHRLFAGASSASEEDIGDESTFNNLCNDDIPVRQENALITSGLEEKEKEIKNGKDMDSENPKYILDFDDNVEPRDRIRWARVQPSGDTIISPSPSTLSAEALMIPTSSSSSSSPSSKLLDSSSTTILTSICDGYLRVRVTGGWMKKIQEKTEECLDSNNQTALITTAKGTKKGIVKGPLVDLKTEIVGIADATILQAPIGLSIEERVKQIAAEIFFNSIEYTPLVTLSNRYKRKLLESVTACTYSAAHKKKSNTSDIKPLPSYHNKSLDSPLLFYLPSNNGLTASCVSCAPVPFSLHDMCSRREMCGFCLTLFLPGMRQFSPAQIAFMTRKEKRNDKRKKSKGGKIIKKLDISEGDINGGGGFEEDEGPSSIMYLLDKTVGTVDYLLHRQCAFAADNGGLFSAPPTPISSDHYMDVEDVAEEQDSVCTGIELGDLYECDESDDAECDLCGKAGGIMQFFDLQSRYSSLPPPGEEGWLGHVPCIMWLIKSRLLELAPSFMYQKKNNDIKSNLMNEDGHVNRNFNNIHSDNIYKEEKVFNPNSHSNNDNTNTFKEDLKLDCNNISDNNNSSANAPLDNTAAKIINADLNICHLSNELGISDSVNMEDSSSNINNNSNTCSLNDESSLMNAGTHHDLLENESVGIERVDECSIMNIENGNSTSNNDKNDGNDIGIGHGDEIHVNNNCEDSNSRNNQMKDVHGYVNDAYDENSNDVKLSEININIPCMHDGSNITDGGDLNTNNDGMYVNEGLDTKPQPETIGIHENIDNDNEKKISCHNDDRFNDDYQNNDIGSSSQNDTITTNSSGSNHDGLNSNAEDCEILSNGSVNCDFSSEKCTTEITNLENKLRIMGTKTSFDPIIAKTLDTDIYLSISVPLKDSNLTTITDHMSIRNESPIIPTSDTAELLCTINGLKIPPICDDNDELTVLDSVIEKAGDESMDEEVVSAAGPILESDIVTEMNNEELIGDKGTLLIENNDSVNLVVTCPSNAEIPSNSLPLCHEAIKDSYQNTNITQPSSIHLNGHSKSEDLICIQFDEGAVESTGENESHATAVADLINEQNKNFIDNMSSSNSNKDPNEINGDNNINNEDNTKSNNLSSSSRNDHTTKDTLSGNDDDEWQPKSLFDTLAGQWRCSFCGTYAGIVLKCSAVACTVRSHPLCVSIAGEGWAVFTATCTHPIPHTDSEENISDTSNSYSKNESLISQFKKRKRSEAALGFLCSLHSPRKKVDSSTI